MAAEKTPMRSLRFKILGMAGLVVAVTQLGTIGAVWLAADRVAAVHLDLTWVLVLCGVALGAAMTGGVFLSRTITTPFQELVQAARRIRDGDYRQPVQIEAGGEVGELARAIDLMQRSIAEREERITWQAAFDSLTGLATRLSATADIADAIGGPDQPSRQVTVMLVDLNNFSDIGLSLGHDIGDALRCQAAERLRAGLDARHLLARLEGDQFLAVLKEAGVDQAREMAEDVQRILGAGLSVRNVSVAADASIGIAGFPDHARDAEELVQRAAFAAREARQSGQEIQVYRAGNEEGHLRQLAILADLRRAARHDEFRLFLQPKIRLADGSVWGAEALLRWEHPAFGFLTPDQFIPLAEKSGNITLITHWALTAAVRECRLWLEEGLDVPVAVNISGRDLHNNDLPRFVLQLLRNHDLPARNLVLEITEAAVVRDLQRATLVLERLRDLGVRISVDDFGTGYSSLSQIKHLPVDELKIDRSFVRDLPGNPDDAAIVRAAIDLAHDLGLSVLAEGVECAAARDWLRSRGCELAQGYLFSKPLPADQFQDWVHGYEQAGRQAGTALRAAS